MDSENHLSIYDSKIIDFIKQFRIFNGSYSDYLSFINGHDNTLEFERCRQFILLCDNDKIIYSNSIRVYPEKEKSITSNNYISKLISKVLDTQWVKRKGQMSHTRFEKIKHEKIKNIIDLNPNIKIIILEIPSTMIKKIEDLENIFTYFNAINLSKRNLLNTRDIQILSFISIAVVIATTIKIVNIIPIQAINETEIILSLKLFVGIFSTIILFNILLLLIAFLFNFEIIQSIKLSFSVACQTWLKAILGIYVISALVLSTLSSIFPNGLIGNFMGKTYSSWILPIDKIAANWYLENKTTLAFDMNERKPIFFLGAKDGVYYYDDEFNNCALKQKIINSNLTDQQKQQTLIHRSLLRIDTNSSESYRNYHWKVASVKDMRFDYNSTLINKTILKCDDGNMTK